MYPQESQGLIVHARLLAVGNPTQHVTAARHGDESVWNPEPGQNFVGGHRFIVRHIGIRRAVDQHGGWVFRGNVVVRAVAIEPVRIGGRVVAGYLLRPNAVLSAIEIEPAARAGTIGNAFGAHRRVGFLL